jgi:M6 family metalloprotease-like protein
MKRLLTCTTFALLSLLTNRTATGIAPPAPGVAIPQAILDRIEQNRKAFRYQNAWIQKVDRIRQNRRRYIQEHGFYHRDLVSAEQKRELSVTGTLYTPVIMVKFANTGSDPYVTSTMDQILFTGPHAPRTLSEYFTEVSYGDFTISGTVYGWYQLSQNDTYYEGPPGCNGWCSTDGKAHEMVLEALAASDATIDFGQFDNDGPDGVPNSGDDDGFADVVTVIQPEWGGECGGDNTWSHHWSLTESADSTYTTDDPAAGGGNIQVNDYVIDAAYECSAPQPNQIGVFAHVYGHALGLPALYDNNGGSYGIGYWGLMGHGLYNTKDNPAHLSSWCKTQLGWSNVIRVGGETTTYVIPAVETNRTVFRLDLPEGRWRRLGTCAISGTYSMRCGLRASEAAGRNWLGGDGYGDMWRERMFREFGYDGTGPVTLTFDYSCSSEPGYDFTYLRIDVGGTVSTLATYDGNATGSANIDLTPYLTGSGVSTYRLSFEFESDIATSDRDGYFNSSCGPFVVDNVGVGGGGESYFGDFEMYEDGWCYDATDVDEYFLVENRQPVGSDVALYSSGGLVIWHINQNVTRTGVYGNTGGYVNSQPRGVAVEQADNLFQLENLVTRGDGGDPFPGNRFNTTFDNDSQPDSRGGSGRTNNIRVINISANPANGGPMSADMSAGYGAPLYSNHSPTSAPGNSVVQVSIDGGLMACGATAELRRGATVISSQNDVWTGNNLIDVEFDLTGAPAGLYDLAVINPGGATVVVSDTFSVDTGPTAVRTWPLQTGLAQNYPNPFNPSTTIPFELAGASHATLRVYNIRGQLVRTLVDGALEAKQYRIEWDGRNDAGLGVSSGVYFYKLVADGFEDVRKMVVAK